MSCTIKKSNSYDEKYLDLAFLMAQKAYENDDVPIGSVLVFKNKVTCGYNEKYNTKLVLRHAEINAICSMCELIGDWRINGSILYVTVFPCLMCIGVIIEARISKVVFGIINDKNYKYKEILEDAGVEVIGPVHNEKYVKILSDFFKEKRQ